MPEHCLLIGDIGGTNARLAVAWPGGGYDGERVLSRADWPEPEDALSAYLKEAGLPAPSVICLAAAGPLVNGNIQLTNGHWYLQADRLASHFGAHRVVLMNDFEAVAWSLPEYGEDDCEMIGELPLAKPVGPDFTFAVIGPGTGLGAAGLVRRGAQTTPIVTEAGHVGFAPESDEQDAILRLLRPRLGHISDELLASGIGLPNLYWALAALNGKEVAPMPAAGIFAAAATDPVADRACQLFFEILGQAAGNLVLTLGAWDGLYIAGGIVPSHREALMRSRFRAAFEDKGPHRELMQTVPTVLITHPQPGLLGAAAMARRLEPAFG